MSYEEQLSAAKFMAERDQARQECERLRARLRDSVPREAYERKRAAWLRQIRECETALHRRRECIKRLENAALERRTVREEDHEAAKWVREHGGLDEVKRRWKFLSHYADHVPRSCMERRLARLQRQIDESHAALKRRNQRIAVLASEINRAHNENRMEFLRRAGNYTAFADEVFKRLATQLRHVEGCTKDVMDAALEALDSCLMPEGCEWPRYEDGEPVQFGDETNLTDAVESITFNADGTTLIGDKHGDFDAKYVQGVKRHIVLAADGEPLEVGQTVWTLDYPSFECSVLGFYKGMIHLKSGADHLLQREPSQLAHRAPVIAADGKPIREGETVWHVGNGVEFTVIGLPNPGEYQSVKLRLDGGASTGLDPDLLTHQRPVLDADGNRIEPAMDVWWICEGDERGAHAEKLHVESIGEDGLVTCDPFNGGTWVELEPSELYVNRPVLDADGVPIKKGDTVWLTDGRGPWKVSRIVCADRSRVICDDEENGHLNAYPEQLTHTKPEIDSWERIADEIDRLREEVALHLGDYLYDEDGNDSIQFSMELVAKRCRALAERGE